MSEEQRQGASQGRAPQWAAHETIEAANERFAYLLSATSAITYSCDLEPPFAATFVSESVTSVLGHGPECFTGDSTFWTERIHPEDREAILASIPVVLETGTHACEYRFRHADGSWRWLHDDRVLHRHDDGTPREMVGCAYDVTVRREAELALKRSESSFRALVEHTTMAVMAHRSGQIVYANAELARMLRYPNPDDLIGRSPFVVVAEPYGELARARARWIETQPEHARTPLVEVDWLRSDGSRVAVEVESLKVDFLGAPACVVLARDISEKRAMRARAAAADRLASIGTLVAGIAHEINNPLAYVQTGITLLAEELPLLLRGDPRSRIRLEDAEQLLRDAVEGTARMQRLVRDLRATLHPEVKQLAPLDVRAVLGTCLRLADADARTRARVITDLADVPPVHANASRLGQIFLNLLINASQAFAEPRAENEIRVSLSHDPSGLVVVEVADNGIGMPIETLERVFEPFFTTKSVGEGTGLGLWICHGIVKSMGGEITVRSRPGEGTTFRVELPAAEASVVADVEASILPLVERARILVVDDEPAYAESVRLLLSRDHDVVALTSAVEALGRLARGDTFDIVLCDLMMPGMTGVEFYEKVKEMAPALLPRLVFVTGAALTPSAQAFLDTIGNLRLEKPFDVRTLHEVLRAVRPQQSTTKR